jgi:Ca2+/Na+ antiporter
MRNRLIRLYPFATLLLGIFLAQILASIHVYLSNINLYDSMVAIKNAGYLPVPNSLIMGQLHNVGPAFWGGLFLTFSVGTGISFLSLSLAWIWDRIFHRKILILYLFLLLLAVCLAALNYNGFNLFVTLYFLLIPPVVFVFSLKSISYVDKQGRKSYEIIHIIPVFLLALLLVWQIDNRMFTDFRDIYLLSNPIGSKINKFYYKYTLYSSEVFKSLTQKMLKTGIFENKKRTQIRFPVNVFLNYDYIPIKGDFDADLKIVLVGDDFILKNYDSPVLRISSKAFFADPHRAIVDFEKKSDRWALFRQITFFSLLTGFPLAVYVILHGIITIVFGFFLNIRTSSLIASALCFLLCFLLLFSFQLNRSRDIAKDNFVEALKSDYWQNRVAALKFIDRNGLEIKQFQVYPKLLKSSYIAERYWFVRTLANSRNPETYKDLLGALNDTHPNVVSMALYGLGKRGNKEAIGRIMQVLEASDDWYHQWYAYKALRALGWKQTKLN